MNNAQTRITPWLLLAGAMLAGTPALAQQSASMEITPVPSQPF